MNEPQGGKTDTLSPDSLPRLDEVNREVFEEEPSDIFNAPLFKLRVFTTFSTSALIFTTSFTLLA